ncbi:transporter substrate-binding domain-containing protein [Limibaculum sp. FT325]|uniref:LysM peptidoglycan-binding domain-containing protein n=1 Tax=Thermohalobaculum sediminis TaxID=2939436 RepID=UPI0020C08D4F|nr:transporter substrate-binding domain-containing protein [Limibaculum sediminis]MCL5777815.1 transporter substrate-binding domain-containing protein [Limibaculum sediminis]
MVERIGVVGVRAAVVAAAVLLGAETDAAAQGAGPIACGTFYTVVRGDTLHYIASRAYPTPDYLAIFRANSGFMRSPAEIEVGDQLLIPCLDGSGFQTREAALAALTPGAEAATSAPAAEGTVAPAPAGPAAGGALGGALARLFVLPDAAPFAGKRLPEGGMATELVSRAMLRAPTPVDYEVVFDEVADGDMSSALDALAEGRFDLAFPAARPDCENAAALSGVERRLCESFAFSAPVAEVETRFYVRAGDGLAAASDAASLSGQRLCRAAERFGGGLPHLPEAQLTRAPRTRDCLDQLAAGAVDVVAASGPGLDRVEGRLRLADAAVEASGLRRRQTIHVIAPRDAARGQVFLGALDNGLDAIRRSGEWSEVVGNHLAVEPGTI